jgi:hypothetical protein
MVGGQLEKEMILDHVSSPPNIHDCKPSKDRIYGVSSLCLTSLAHLVEYQVISFTNTAHARLDVCMHVILMLVDFGYGFGYGLGYG